MAKVQICSVTVLNNPSSFSTSFKFELTFECTEELQHDLEWKMIYVGSAESEEYDQVLDTILVGPITEGKHMFVFEADAPDPSKIPVADAIGVTVVLLSCCYKDQEFARIGYFVNNEYNEPVLKESPPSIPQFDKVIRSILVSEPRVTRFKISWDEPENKASENAPPEQSTSTAFFPCQKNEDPTASLYFSDSSCSQSAMEVS